MDCPHNISPTNVAPRKRIIPKWVIILFFVLATLIGGGVFIMSQFLDAIPRKFVARVQADMRTYEVAMQAYKNDNGSYPSWSLNAPPLTTPVSYLHSMIPDSFLTVQREPPETGQSESPENWIKFATSGNDFLIWSVGPDGKSQITGAPDIEAGYRALSSKIYDSTNGIASSGDLVRTGLFLNNSTTGTL